ncbi:MAG: pyridoxal-phosphate dependent enzyme [Actinomycetota bacterium]|nr:pyridoxal-phosphate dependent enzyme [Actinomycetota bacterium]
MTATADANPQPATAAPGLETTVVDPAVVDRVVDRFRSQGIVLPTFAQLAEPGRIPASITSELATVDPDAPDPRNLFRVHWYNAPDRRGLVDVPVHLVLPPELTGVDATIVTVLGRLFPMIGAHKVLAAYACLVPRLVSGGFDPTTHRAVWPSTGNYARGGVAISRIMGCRGVAVLPAGMSRERFEWLDRWVADPADVIRTPGSESNVKEIYDACNELSQDPDNVILNQFSEYSNHLGHYHVTGRALAHTFEHVREARGGGRLAAFVAASGSAGTLGAGDLLKERYGSKTVAVEALECPTLLYNGYGEHNIQGIGDKHLPLIHNVTNQDIVCAVSDRATDELGVLFNTEAGHRHLTERVGVDPDLVERLPALGLSSICNVLAAIKTAKQCRLGVDDIVMTVATDGAELYLSERDKYVGLHHPDGFGAADAAAAHARHLEGVTTDHLLEMTSVDRDRIFNLGYFTWVEQQGIDIEHFDARRDQAFWRGLHHAIDAWDPMIDEINARTGLLDDR